MASQANEASSSAVGPRPGAVRPDHAVLWSGGPVLRPSGRSFGGRILVEVMEDGTAISVTGDLSKNLTLLRRAVAALKTSKAVHQSVVALPATPITGRPASRLAGRVIVEFWEDGPVVGVMGASAEMVRQAALQHLSSLDRSSTS